MNYIYILTDALGFCEDEGVLKAFKIAGTFLKILKIVVPILIIILGSVDFGKAVISDDQKAISKSAQSLGKRLIAGIIIFFIPTIINVVFNVIDGFDDVKSDFTKCTNCLLSDCNEKSDLNINYCNYGSEKECSTNGCYWYNISCNRCPSGSYIDTNTNACRKADVSEGEFVDGDYIRKCSQNGSPSTCPYPCSWTGTECKYNPSMNY